MTYRQFMWGLSNGVFVLVVAGLVWIGVAVSNWPRGVALLLIVVPCFVALFVGAIRMRRKATGFSLAEVRRGSPEQRHETRKIIVGFRWITLGETLMTWTAGYLCFRLQRMDLIWPAVGLAVALHFLPLASLFRVNTYYWTGLLSAAVAIVAMLGFEGAWAPWGLVFLGLGMGGILWVSAAHLVRHADDLARRGDIRT